MNEIETLVTGVSGFAGWHVAASLASRHPVAGTFLDHPIDIAGARTLAVDLRDESAVRGLIRSSCPRVVIHAAGLTEPNDCEQRPDAATLANEGATRHLARALDELAPDAHLVFFSTDLVYPGDRPFSKESDPVSPLMHYGRTKIAAENAVRARRGSWTILRCALLYGPPAPLKGGATGWMRARLERGEPLTLFTDEYRTPVHVADVVATIERLIETPAGHGIVNLGGSERLTRFEMGVTLARALGRPSDSVRPSQRAEAKLPAPRPADVSMDTARLTALLGRAPLSFQAGVELLEPGSSPR